MFQQLHLWLLAINVSACNAILKNILINSECPDLESEISKDACLAEACTNDLDCGSKAMCCSNGCVSTCLEVEPPIAFDWIEETAQISNGRNNVITYESETVTEHDGCHMTPQQSVRIKKLLETNQITDCFCNLGGYYCHVPQR